MSTAEFKLFYKGGALYCHSTPDKRQYFYEDGTVKTVEPYCEGRLDGEVVLYWPNGNVKRTCSFCKGARHGHDRMWNEEGVLVDEGSYEAGKPVGTHRRYKESLIEEIVYLEGPRFNIRQWDEQGILRLEAIWSDPMTYRERAWDRFQQIWVEKEGRWDGKKLVYV